MSTSTFPTSTSSAVVQSAVGSLTTSSTVTIAVGSWTSTGISVTITPTSASNKLWITGYINIGLSGTSQNAFIQVQKGSTPIFVGDAAGSRMQVSGVRLGTVSSDLDMITIPIDLMDTSITATSTTYTIYVTGDSGTGTTVGINRTVTNTNSTAAPLGASFLNVIELSA